MHVLCMSSICFDIPVDVKLLYDINSMCFYISLCKFNITLYAVINDLFYCC